MKAKVLKVENLETKPILLKNYNLVLANVPKERLIILDSSVYSGVEYLDNYIPFPPFEGDEKDPCLFYLGYYLESLVLLDDFRVKIGKAFS